MQFKTVAIGSVLVVFFTLTVFARAETAAESFAKGKKLLAKGDFTGAIQSYAAAARADQSNQDYSQNYAILRRIIDFRSRLSTETKPQQWEYMVRALRAFYVNERLYTELLKLDQLVHEKLNSPESAALLAETQLAMNQNAEAVKTLSAIDPNKATDMAQLLLGIALVRSGKAEEAKKIAAKYDLPKDAGPNVIYTAARLQASTGDSAKTMQLLATCFETTMPSQVDGFKSHAKTCPEFAAIASTAEFAKVLETKSKMSESKCSGGSSCAGCPMRGKCSKSQSNQ